MSVHERAEQFSDGVEELTDGPLRIGGVDIEALRAEADTVNVTAETRGKLI